MLEHNTSAYYLYNVCCVIIQLIELMKTVMKMLNLDSALRISESHVPPSTMDLFKCTLTMLQPRSYLCYGVPVSSDAGDSFDTSIAIGKCVF
jgi:hypothetical protein